MVIPSAPVFAFIQLTPECNNRCPGCSNVFLDGVDERPRLPPPLSPTEWKTVFQRLSPFVTQLRVTGGEPTLYPYLEEVLSYIAQLRIPFVLFSNGRWNDARRLLPMLKSNDCFAGMLVSLHGATASSHEAFNRIQGSYEETVANVKLALQEGMRVHTNTVITRQNYDQIGRIYDFARSLGVPRVVMARYVGEPIDGLDITTDQLRQAIRQIEDMKNGGAHLRHSGCVPQCCVRSTAYGCTAGYTFFTVDPWANVSPCNHVSIRCGNLLEQSVTDVWESRAMQEWRQAIPQECFECLAFSVCHGGCRAAAISAGSMPDPLMERPLTHTPTIAQHRVQVTLDKMAKPSLCCQVRAEGFGYLLIKGPRCLPVSRGAREVLDACDGNTSLLEIRERFGQEALNLIGAMKKRGFVEFEPE